MEYLLDTHICLWTLGDYNRISSAAKIVLEQENSKIFVSQVSLLEIAIKLNIGKLVDLKVTLDEFIQLIKANGVEVLPVKEDHIIAYSHFEFHTEHKDPFDRYLIATAFNEHKTLITKDQKFHYYTDRINILW